MKKIETLQEKVVLKGIEFENKIKCKLLDVSGADGSTEKTGWIITSIILVGLVIGFVRKFAPEFTSLIEDKFKEMFNIIKFD